MGRGHAPSSASEADTSLTASLPKADSAAGSAQSQSRSPAWMRSMRNVRSEEHTSELQSPCNLVCRLLLEKKKKTKRHRFGHVYRFHSSSLSSDECELTAC